VRRWRRANRSSGELGALWQPRFHPGWAVDPGTSSGPFIEQPMTKTGPVIFLGRDPCDPRRRGSTLPGGDSHTNVARRRAGANGYVLLLLYLPGGVPDHLSLARQWISMPAPTGQSARLKHRLSLAKAAH
jgi:hypothetical protein